MTKKKLALGKGALSLAIILVYAAFWVFFYTYGKNAMQRAADKLGEQKTMGGLGIAFLMTFDLVALVAFAVPALLLLISCIGNFASKGNKKGFTVLSLIAEILALIVLFFISLYSLEAALYDVIVVLAVAVFDALTIASFVHSVVALVKYKNADDE